MAPGVSASKLVVARYSVRIVVVQPSQFIAPIRSDRLWQSVSKASKPVVY